MIARLKALLILATCCALALSACSTASAAQKKTGPNPDPVSPYVKSFSRDGKATLPKRAKAPEVLFDSKLRSGNLYLVTAAGKDSAHATNRFFYQRISVKGKVNGGAFPVPLEQNQKTILATSFGDDGSLYYLYARQGLAFAAHQLTDGSLDRSFGNDGEANAIGIPISLDSSITKLPNGAIAITSALNATTTIFRALDANGNTDPSFDGGGAVTLLQTRGAHVTQGLGRYYVTGRLPGPVPVDANRRRAIGAFEDGAHAQVIAIRTDGTLDTSFGGGRVVVDPKELGQRSVTSPLAFALPDGSINLQTLSRDSEVAQARMVHVGNAGQAETCPPGRYCAGIGMVIGLLYPPRVKNLTTGFQVSPLLAGAFETWIWNSYRGDHNATGFIFTSDRAHQHGTLSLRRVDPITISRIETINGRARAFVLGSLDGAIRVLELRPSR